MRGRGDVGAPWPLHLTDAAVAVDDHAAGSLPSLGVVATVRHHLSSYRSISDEDQEIAAPES
jgi:hypothetical protein